MSVTVSGTSGARLAQEQLGRAARAAEHVDESNGDPARARARAAKAVSCSMKRFVLP